MRTRMLEWGRVVEDIRTGRIHSSTEVVFYAMDKMLEALTLEKRLDKFAELALHIVRARPTSALLANSIRELAKTVLEYSGESPESVLEKASSKVAEIKERIKATVEETSSIAEKRLEDGDTVLTASYSVFVKKTIEKAIKGGKEIRVIVTESRPGSEGVRLAAELAGIGCDVTLIVDSAVRYVMKNVDKVLLSSESVTANGANVNKVGSSQIALAAHEARVRVFVVTSTLKFSPETLVGGLVEIPEADTTEIKNYLAQRGIEGVKVRAPLFDVTPPEYIDAIITEKGLVAPSFVIMTVRDLYGWPPKPTPLENLLTALAKVGTYGG
ncbi:translation initiation factor eIF-2B [Infirmifilum sp. NZ]|uniref:translation initiation factor eIF-2B n=1 Tax=Infirmifilum sp. NZ TaxID=2926850 RepID=UPI00279B429D|nr:hypothetical protein [Infirmifilum sp. NZ]UNQ74331.1 hypothetical protein MOV14_04820 [Infirmifilum sp. NZ]